MTAGTPKNADLPTLIVISGPGASGKTTLAHGIAALIACPVVSRDEIKEGMVHATATFTPDWGDPLTVRASVTFFEVIRLLLDRGVTHVVEAAFGDEMWRANLESVRACTYMRVVQCRTSPVAAHRRAVERGSRRAHVDGPLLQGLQASQDAYMAFDRYDPDAPTLNVDTTNGYEPTLDEVTDFINRTHPLDHRSE